MALEQIRKEFDERMSNLEEEIKNILLSIEGIRGNQIHQMQQLTHLTNRHDEQLNGYQDKPGVVVRIDRLEQELEGRRWHIRMLWTAVIAGIVKSVADLFMNRR